MKSLFALFCIVSLLYAPFAARAADSPLLDVDLAPVGGAHHTFVLTPTAANAVTPVVLCLTLRSANAAVIRADVSFAAEDIFGKPVDWQRQVAIEVPADGKAVETYVAFPSAIGYFSFTATVKTPDGTQTGWTDVAIVLPPYPGVRPDSFFASNASLKAGEDLAFLAAEGIKVVRTHFLPAIREKGNDWPRQLPPGTPPALDFSSQDKLWAQQRAAGIWALPIIGYALPNDLSQNAIDAGMYGPPGDEERFANTYVQILRHYPEITTVEFWNEPWIFGWDFAGTPADYRRLQKLTVEKLLQSNPSYRVIAGSSSMFVADNIEPDPSSWKGLLEGVSHHPYAQAGDANYRAGANTRTIDDHFLIARRMGLPFAYITEGGSLIQSPETGPQAELSAKIKVLRDKLQQYTTTQQRQSAEFKSDLAELKQLQATTTRYPDRNNNNMNATKIVQYYVRAAMQGMFQGNMQWQLGYGPGWTRSNATLATMTHFLEDRPPAADIWPNNELIWGGIFANPRHITDEVRALPRASELSARWNVPVPVDRADDLTKVAVLWSLTGKSNEQLDAAGTLTIRNIRRITGYDMVGRRILPAGGVLRVPFGQAPVYITSDILSVIELKQRIASATLENLTAVNLYPFSLAQDASQKQDLIIRIENQMNHQISGKVKVTIDGVSGEIAAPFEIETGLLTDVKLPWPGVAASPTNQYAITIRADVNSYDSVDVEPITCRQIIESAHFVKRTIDTAKTLDQWQGVVPVLLDSSLMKSSVDLTQYLLNPNLEQPTGNGKTERIVARVYTAYDDANVYITAAVNEDSFKCSAGEPVEIGPAGKEVKLPYRNGFPDGLNYITQDGDVFQFSFGFRDRVPGFGRQMNDPWTWKGEFYDTDCSYVAHTSTEGDQLIRIWGPDTPRINGYQAEAVPSIGPVPGGQIRIIRDEGRKLTIYNIAIPRAEMKLFNPAAGRCRFGFIVNNDEKIGTDGLEWGEASGVFDHWVNSGSYPPTWSYHRACQTYFGIDSN